MTSNLQCRFGSIVLETGPGHIHLEKGLPSFYDYGPWQLVANLVNDLIDSGQLKSGPRLIDIGANIGDSAAIWRSHFQTEAICIEPSEHFFRLLKKNSDRIKNCVLVNKLYNASVKLDLLKFTSGRQTGSTEVLDGKASAQLPQERGYSAISLDEIIKMGKGPCVLKTDTDGFDVHILSDIVQNLGAETPRVFPIIFAEGPTKKEMESLSKIARACDVYQRFLANGFHATLFTNYGHLYCHCGSSIEVMKSCFYALRQGILNRKKACGYFDIILSTNNNAFRVIEEFAQSYSPVKQ